MDEIKIVCQKNPGHPGRPVNIGKFQRWARDAHWVPAAGPDFIRDPFSVPLDTQNQPVDETHVGPVRNNYAAACPTCRQNLQVKTAKIEAFQDALTLAHTKGMQAISIQELAVIIN